MKLRYEFTIMDMGDDIAAVPVGENAGGFHGMLRLNDVSAEIIGLLGEDTTPRRIHSYLKEKYPDSSDKEISDALTDFLNRLDREGLLIVP